GPEGLAADRGRVPPQVGPPPERAVIEKEGEVGLADLADALRLLAPRGSAALGTIAGLLGLTLEEEMVRSEPAIRSSPPPAMPARREASVSHLAPDGPVLIPLALSGEVPIVADDEPLPSARPLPRPEGVPWTSVRLPLMSLLRPMWTAGVLGRLASSAEPVG